jgi:hypothetical protein
MELLCIDTEPETMKTIEAADHTIVQGDIGFRTGRPNLQFPPHEFDLLICDLRRPACYDVTHWGHGMNDNFHCKIEKEVSDTSVRYSDGRTRPKFEIIHTQQMPSRPVGTFGPTEIFTAVSKAGVPFILFLNKEWLCHVGYRVPNFCDVWWQFNRTKATKVQTSALMDMVLAAAGKGPELALPFEFSIAKGAHRQDAFAQSQFRTMPLVSNAVSQVFGEVVILERGAIWAMPQFLDNARFCVALLERFEEFLSIQSSFLVSHSSFGIQQQATSQCTATIRDVFISHASEDKVEIARPLA